MTDKEVKKFLASEGWTATRSNIKLFKRRFDKAFNPRIESNVEKGDRFHFPYLCLSGNGYLTLTRA